MFISADTLNDRLDVHVQVKATGEIHEWANQGIFGVINELDNGTLAIMQPVNIYWLHWGDAQHYVLDQESETWLEAQDCLGKNHTLAEYSAYLIAKK